MIFYKCPPETCHIVDTQYADTLLINELLSPYFSPLVLPEDCTVNKYPPLFSLNTNPALTNIETNPKTPKTDFSPEQRQHDNSTSLGSHSLLKLLLQDLATRIQ